MDFDLPPLDGAERIYRALLYLYPRRFRDAFARDLVETFRDERRSVAGLGDAAAFWLRTVADLTTQGLAERANDLLGRSPNFDNQDRVAMPALSRALTGGELTAALRRLRRAPSFSIATLIVLGLGVGVTTTLFSIVNGVVLKPLPYPDPDRLVAIQHTVQVDGAGTVDQSDAGLLFYQEHAHAFTASGGWRDRDVNVVPPNGVGGQAERISGAQVTANLFDVLGVKPALGRTFLTGEDRVGAPRLVVLSDRLWRRYFNGEPDAIGRVLSIDGASYRIVGVMPRTMTFIKSAPELWYPATLDPAQATIGSFNYRSVGRLAPGQTLASATADLKGIFPGLIDEFPSGVPRAMWEHAHVTASLTPLRDYIVGDVARLLWILLASAGLVLLIACANVASLFLVRGESRQLELAIRGALGSGLSGIVGSALSESLLLAAAGGVFGIVITAFATHAAAVFGQTLRIPRLDQVTLDANVLLFAISAIVVSGIGVSILPAIRARRIPIGTVLREGTRGGTAGRSRQRARSMLVVAQISLGLLLVASSALLARSFMRLRNVQPGFRASGIIMARVVLPPASYPTRASVRLAHERLLTAVRAVPGVRSASITDLVPLTDDQNNAVVSVEDHPLPPNVVPPVRTVASVDAEYFRTMGIPILTGRTLGAPVSDQPMREVVVSRSFANHYWPGGSPLGKRIHFDVTGPWMTIVGEVGDVHYDGLDKPVNEAIYVPAITTDSAAHLGVPRYMALMIDAGDRAGAAFPEIRAAVRAVDSSLPTYDEHTLTQVVEDASARARVTLVLLVCASVIALILGGVGIYGVMAYAVSMRHREIGVRIALGAQPKEVGRMISRQGLQLAAAGIVIGGTGAVAFTRVLRGLLFEISPTDPIALGGTCLALLLIAFVASWAPARRAATIDPAEALRRG